MLTEDTLLIDSVIDFPRETLCPDIWVMNQDGEYELTENARNLISELVDHMIQKFDIPDCSVNITGSITSNSYTDDADIDVHFHSGLFKNPDVGDEFNRLFRAEFDEWKTTHNWKIKQHPLEVYFQVNEFQDMMSVGCYNFTTEQWLVGPEMTDLDFDPYEEYYPEVQKRASKFIDDIRQIVMKGYEDAMILKKLETKTDTKIYRNLMNEFEDDCAKAKDTFDEVRLSRKVMSAPKSKEEALRMRDSREWKIADATFKVMNKFGYLAILKSMAQDLPVEDKIDEIITAMQDNIAKEND